MTARPALPPALRSALGSVLGSTLGSDLPQLSDAPGADPARPRHRDLGTQLRRALRRHRRLVAAACAGLACVLAVDALAPRAPAATTVVAAARDLSAGTQLSAGDLRLVRLPPAAVPAGALDDAEAAVGRMTSGPLRRGEPLTDVRLDDGGLLRPPAPGMVAAPVRLADAQAAALLRPGERVDVLAASTAPVGPSGADLTSADPGVDAASAAVVAGGVTVVEVPPVPSANADLASQGALVVLAASPAQARLLAQAQVSARLFAVVVG